PRLHPCSTLFPYTTLFRSVSVRVIDVGPSAPRIAWIAEARPIEVGGRRFLHARVGASGNEPQERTLRVKGLPELGDLSEKVTIQDRKSTRLNSSHLGISYA